MDTSTARDIEIALKQLQSSRERQRRCYENNREERQAKRRAYYWKQKEEAEARRKETDEVAFREAVEKAVREKLVAVGSVV